MSTLGFWRVGITTEIMQKWVILELVDSYTPFFVSVGRQVDSYKPLFCFLCI